MALPDLEQYYNSPDIQSAQQNATNAQQTAVNYASAASQLPSKLREAIQQKLDYNKDIIAEQNKAMGDYFAAPSAARSQYQNIWNPFDREKLVAQKVSNAYAPYATLTDILGQRMGRIDDIVSAGTGAFQSGVTASQGAAELARQAYTDKVGIADKLAEIAKWGYEQKTKGSGSGGLSDFANFLNLMKGTNAAADEGEQFTYELPEMNTDVNNTPGLTVDNAPKGMPLNFGGLNSGLSTSGNLSGVYSQPVQTGGGISYKDLMKKYLGIGGSPTSSYDIGNY